MSFQEVCEVIESVGAILRNDSIDNEQSQVVFSKLSPVVKRSSSDESYRRALANEEFIWKEANNAMEGLQLPTILYDDITLTKIRALRGLLLLLRNLSASNQELPLNLLVQNKVINSFAVISLNFPTQNDMVTDLFLVTCSLLHNISQNVTVFDKTWMHELMILLKYPVNITDRKDHILLPYLMYLLRVIQNDDFLYEFFRNDDCDDVFYHLLIQDMITNGSNIITSLRNKEENVELESKDLILLKILHKVASNESFEPYIERTENANEIQFLNIIRLMQLVITSSDNWDKYELTGIMSWCFRIFDQTVTKIEEYFQQKLENEEIATFLYSKIVTSMDIISKICQFEHGQKFVLFYKGLEKLIRLLKIFQDNLLRINFQKDKKGILHPTPAPNTNEDQNHKLLIEKRVDRITKEIKKSNFPECKTIVIEILMLLIHHNKEVQDQIRELHGLELILSNCVIDDNDPFIKERSIVCIRFLLAENKLNQDFVAKLEAKKPVQSDVLSEAGYEVKINDSGNVELTSSGKKKLDSNTQ